MAMKKRGQITLFIIIAVVLLFASAIFFYFRNYQSNQVLEPQVTQTIVVPEEIKPLKTFVDKCLTDTATEGVMYLGLQAGWINVGSQFRRPVPGLTTGDVLEVAPNFYIPYWYYQKNGVETVSNVPTLTRLTSGPSDTSMQRQLANFIKSNITTCLNNFKQFKSQGYEIEQMGELRVKIDFNEEDIAAKIYLPLKVTRLGKTSEINDFSSTVPVRMKKIYSIAMDILYHETFLNTYEVITLNNLMPIYERIDSEGLPPRLGGFKTEICAEKISWPILNAKDTFDSMLSENYYYIHYNHTRFNQFKPTRAEMPNIADAYAIKNFVDGLVINALSEEYDPEVYKQFEITVRPMPTTYFSINGLKAQGGILSPNSIDISTIFTPGRCQNIYDFSYSFEYPILVTIKDLKPGSDFEFQFPMAIIVKNNAPRQPLFPPQSQIAGNRSLLQIVEMLECSQDQELSPPVKINLVNSRNPDLAITSAYVTYQCGPTSSFCSVGYTTEDEDGKGSLSSEMQLCSGGMIKVTHPDYMDAYYPFSSTDITANFDPITINMVPLKNYDIELITYNTSITAPYGVDLCTIDTGDIIKLDTSNSVFMTLSRLMLNKSDRNDYQPTVLPFVPGEMSKLKLGPGTYRAVITVNKNYPDDKPLVIKYGAEIINGIYVPSKDTELKSVPVGAAEVTFKLEDSNYWQKSKITFFTTNEGEPSKLSQYGAPINHMELCKGNVLTPSIS